MVLLRIGEGIALVLLLFLFDRSGLLGLILIPDKCNEMAKRVREVLLFIGILADVIS